MTTYLYITNMLRRAALGAALACCGSVAQAALAPDSVRFRWTENNRLVVDLPAVQGNHKVKSDYRMVVTPVLKGTDGDSLVLNPVMYAGKRYRRYAERQARLAHTQVDDMRELADPAGFTQEVEVQPWMREQPVQLVLHRECEGCCRVKTLPSETLGTTRYVSPFVPQPLPVDKRLSIAETLAMHEPLLKPAVEYKPYNASVPLRKQKDALIVHFPVSKSELKADFRQNRETLQRIDDIMERIGNDTLSKVVKVVIVGLASPEGPQALNQKLATRRAEALRKHIQEHANLSDDVFEVIGAGEAWADLRDVVAECNLPERDEALEIIDKTENPEERERLIRHLNGGRLFRYLKREVFVEQRNAGYIQAYYEVVPDREAEQINRAVALMQQGKPDEALELLLQVKDDPRAYNALGSAYYLTGERNKAIDYYRKAAANGDEGAKANLKELKME